jgi:two-component system, LuxR family, response regulator FixJ
MSMTEGRQDRGLVHVVDDEDAVRRSMDFLLRTAGYQVERWPDGESFLKGAGRAARACVILDLRLPGLSGLQVQERMAQEGLCLPVIMLTGHGDIDLAVRAMKAGAMDFLVKPCERDKLLQSIAQGFRQIDDREALRERQTWARTQLTRLTDREREVLDGLACGYPNKTIAYDLGISSRTVEVYRANVMIKLEVTNFADVLRIAFAADLGTGSRWRQAHGLNGSANCA